MRKSFIKELFLEKSDLTITATTQLLPSSKKNETICSISVCPNCAIAENDAYKQWGKFKTNTSILRLHFPFFITGTFSACGTLSLSQKDQDACSEQATYIHSWILAKWHLIFTEPGVSGPHKNFKHNFSQPVS